MQDCSAQGMHCNGRQADHESRSTTVKTAICSAFLMDIGGYVFELPFPPNWHFPPNWAL